MQLIMDPIWVEVATAQLVVNPPYPHTSPDGFTGEEATSEVVGTAQTCSRNPIHPLLYFF